MEYDDIIEFSGKNTVWLLLIAYILTYLLACLLTYVLTYLLLDNDVLLLIITVLHSSAKMTSAKALLKTDVNEGIKITIFTIILLQPWNTEKPLL